jgi:predicted NACHT family NTPase
VLKAIEAQHGIFVERARGIYSFSHLTFQEYFTAKYIVENAGKRSLERLVSSYLFKPHWREVILNTAGIVQEADHLLKLIIAKVRLPQSRDLWRSAGMTQ